MYRVYCITFAMMLALGGSVGLAGTSEAAQAVSQKSDVGVARAIQGFSVTLRSVERAHEAGAADYVAARTKIFLLVSIEVRRQGGHGSYYVDAQDFHIETSRGEVIDSEQFGLAHELKARHIQRQPIAGTIGFEVPAARDAHLRLLWQPTFESSPDAQGVWLIGASGRTVQYQQ